jgi:hypothetical protein
MTNERERERAEKVGRKKERKRKLKTFCAEANWASS